MSVRPLKYRPIDLDRIRDSGVRSVLGALDERIRSVNDVLSSTIAPEQTRGEIRWQGPIIPRILTKDPRDVATFGQLNEVAVQSDTQALFVKTLTTAMDTNWSLAGAGATAPGDIGIFGPPFDPTLVDIETPYAGFTPYAARADHHHRLDETISPGWTGLHTFTPSSDDTPITIALPTGQTSDAFLLTVADVDTVHIDSIGKIGINVAPDAWFTAKNTGSDPAADIFAMAPWGWWSADYMTAAGSPSGTYTDELDLDGMTWYDRAPGHAHTISLDGTGVSSGSLVFKANEQNGLPAVRFGDADFGLIAPGVTTFSGGWTMFTVYRKPTGNTGSNVIPILDNSGDTLIFLATPGRTNDSTPFLNECWRVQYAPDGSDGYFSHNGSGIGIDQTYDVTTYHVHAAMRSDATTPNLQRHRTWRDGTLIGNNTSSAPNFTFGFHTDPFSFNRFHSPFNGLEAWYLETILFDRAVTAAEEAAVHAYLNNKYELNGGTAPDPTFPFANFYSTTGLRVAAVSPTGILASSDAHMAAADLGPERLFLRNSTGEIARYEKAATGSHFGSNWALTQPTAERTITIPDKTGTLVLDTDAGTLFEVPLTFTAPLVRTVNTISLADTAVTPGDYYLPKLTVDQKGRLTFAASHKTTLTGLLKGDGTNVTAATGGTDYEFPLTFSNGVTRSVNAVSSSGNLLTLYSLGHAAGVLRNDGVGGFTWDNTNVVGANGITALANTVELAAGNVLDLFNLVDANGVLRNTGGTLSWDTTGYGTGTVTSVSVATANGFTGTVATPTTTPAITLKTTVTGLLKGDAGTGVVSAATANVDYVATTRTITPGAGLVGAAALDLSADRTLDVGAGLGITVNANDVAITLGLANRVLGMNAAANNVEYKDILGTANEISVTHAANSITLAFADHPILATKGGTGIASYAIGDLLYANTTTTLAKLADVAVGSVLASGGTNTAPLWKTLATAGIVAGSGTTSTLPKWTDGPNGVLGDSNFTDPGTYSQMVGPTGATYSGAQVKASGSVASGELRAIAGSALSGNASGGNFVSATGAGFGAGDGGTLQFSGGAGGATGNGGQMNFVAGIGGATSGDGGAVQFQGGNATAGNGSGGSIILTPGRKNGSGSNGTVQFYDPSSGVAALFSTASLATSSKTFTFPNATGTFALTSNLPVGANPTGTGVDLAGVNGVATTFLRSDGAPKLNVGIAPTWTGAHIFNTSRTTFNAGITLGTDGTLQTSVADGAAAIGFDLNDQITRTQGFEFQIRNGATKFMETTWDGRFSFGYAGNVASQTGHVLAFLAADSASPTSNPTYVGILGYVNHDDTAETAAKLYGVAGISVVTQATGLGATLAGGILGTGVGAIASSSLTGKVLAGVVGKVIGGPTLADAEPADFDKVATGIGTRTVRGNFDHATCFWGDYLAHNSTTSFPAAGSRPLIGSTLRAPIQGFPCGTTAGAADGQAWAIYGEAPSTGSASNFPATTGFMRIPYPRRTGGTTPAVHAMQLFWEPWPNTTTIRGGAVAGDTYFDDGTNFRTGLWEYAGGLWHKLLQTQAVDALGVGAVALLGLIGGTGPTVAAQNKWIRVKGTDGTTYWVPAWV